MDHLSIRDRRRISENQTMFARIYGHRVLDRSWSATEFLITKSLPLRSKDFDKTNHLFFWKRNSLLLWWMRIIIDNGGYE